VDPSLKLTESERLALDRIRERLRDEGLKLTDEGLLIAVLQAAIQLPRADLLQLIRNGLEAGREPRTGSSS
jgi:hypothetical protein